MKIPSVNKFGKWLMSCGGIRIAIIDDESTYFHSGMINAAKSVGFRNIERIYRVDSSTLDRLLKDPPHIVILDIRGVADKDVAKNGLGLAALFSKHTGSYIAITSAHRFHLSNQVTHADYVIENRLLSIVDFVDELRKITEDFIGRRNAFYKLVIFRCGWAIAKSSLHQS